MLAYILDNRNLKIKDILEFEKFDFKEDIEFSEKSSITVAKKPTICNDDFVFCKDDHGRIFTGICENFNSNSNDSEYKISLLQIENLFDRQIFVNNESLIFNTGIEDFIRRAIIDNFVSSGDILMDKKYITVVAVTHTPIAAKVDAKKGVFNLKTYLGNVKEFYGIFMEFDFTGDALSISIRRNEEPIIPIDIEVTDISDYKETYSVSVLARLLVKWKIPDREISSGSIQVGALTEPRFFLLSDRTVTEDISNVDRAAGVSKSVYIETEKEEEMLQQVYNEFSANRYSHKISFSLRRGSRLYPSERFYVGRKCTIKTKTGVKSSLITKAEVTSTSSMIGLTFGKLKITLIEKLRG